MPLKPSLIMIRVARIVIMFWLMGWFLKTAFYAPYLWESIRFPMSHELFPAFFQNPYIALAAYFFPMVVIGIFFVNNVFYLRIAAIVMLLCAGLMNLHISTHNDATFVTSFWTALWLVWLTAGIKDQEATLSVHAQALAQGVLSLIFLGGFVGKLTPEFWRGEVVANIFLTPGNTSPLNWIINCLPLTMKSTAIGVIAKSIVVVEGFFVLAPLFPLRVFVRLAVPGMLFITLFSTWRILSVLSCMVGLLWACLYWEQSDRSSRGASSQIHA